MDRSSARPVDALKPPVFLHLPELLSVRTAGRGLDWLKLGDFLAD